MWHCLVPVSAFCIAGCNLVIYSLVPAAFFIVSSCPLVAFLTFLRGDTFRLAKYRSCITINRENTIVVHGKIHQVPFELYTTRAHGWVVHNSLNGYRRPSTQHRAKTATLTCHVSPRLQNRSCMMCATAQDNAGVIDEYKPRKQIKPSVALTSSLRNDRQPRPFLPVHSTSFVSIVAVLFVVVRYVSPPPPIPSVTESCRVNRISRKRREVDRYHGRRRVGRHAGDRSLAAPKVCLVSSSFRLRQPPASYRDDDCTACS